MKRAVTKAASLFALIFGVLGCATDWATTSVRSCANLNSGEWVRITDCNNQILTGTYLETESMPFLDYLDRSRSMTAGNPECAALPVPGERISFATVLDPTREWHGIMLGFCLDYLWVKLHGDADISRFYITGIMRIVGWDGRMIQRHQLRELLSCNKVPLRSVLALRHGPDTLHVAVNDIKTIEVVERGTHRNLNIFARLPGVQTGRGG